jgi:hypothetical protein
MAKKTPREPEVIKAFVRELPVMLSQEELVAKGDEVAKLHRKASELRIKKKQMTDEISGEIKGAEGAISVLVGHIRTRTENREIRCEERVDWEAGIANTIRLDTDEIISKRALLPEERQKTLRGIDGGKKPEKEEDGEAGDL